MLELRQALLVVGQQLQETIHIALVHQTAASRAGVTLALGVLVAEIMTSAGRVAFEAVCRLAETLRRGPVGFQLGHDHSLPCCQSSQGVPAWLRPGTPACSRIARLRLINRALHDHFFFGANSITICRPSISGFCSTTLCAARSPCTRSRSLRPM